MADDVDTDKLHMISEDFSDLKQNLLAKVCIETQRKLLLYQQGRYLQTVKTTKDKKYIQYLGITEDKDQMPSAEVLNAIKLDKELDTLRNIYNIAYDIFTKDNLDEINPYAKLSKAIEDLKQSDNEVYVLTNELKENKSTLKDLEREIKTKESEFTEKISQKSQQVKNLQDQLNYINRIHRLELSLVKKWENNRFAQATIVAEKKDFLLKQKILDLHRHIAGEQRFICEIESFRNNEISDLKDKIAFWEQKLKEEETAIDAKNLTLTQKITDVIKSHEKHRDIIEQRKHFVAEYLRQKTEEQRLYEEQRYRIVCAIRIQAWWRGLMVRRCLGPYRKKSKKGKRNKNKKLNKY